MNDSKGLFEQNLAARMPFQTATSACGLGSSSTRALLISVTCTLSILSKMLNAT